MLQRGRPKNNISRRCVDRVLRSYPRLFPSPSYPLFLSLSFALLYHLKQQVQRPSVLLRPVLNLIENSCLVELRRLYSVYRVSPLFLSSTYNQCHRPGGELRDDGKVRVKRWGLGGEERKTVNATGCGKFEYGICLLVSPSLFAEAGRKERTGCEGRMRFVIGATSAVCKVALMFAPFMRSRPHLCSLLLPSSPPPPMPGSERIAFFPYRAVSFSLLLILVTFNRVCFHFSRSFKHFIFMSSSFLNISVWLIPF